VRTPRIQWSIFAGLVIALFVAIFPASPVSAHASLDNSAPASGATVATSPPQIVLDFDETVETALGFIHLYDSSGGRIDGVSNLRQDGSDASIVRVDLPTLDNDTFVAAFRVISVDGHRVDGAITFKVGEGAPDDVSGVVADALAGGVDDTGVELAMQAVRIVGYLALALVLAGIFFGLGTTLVVRRWLIIGNAVLALSSLALLGLQGALIAGDSLGGVFSADSLDAVLGTRVGEAILVRGIIAVVLLLLAVAWRTASFTEHPVVRVASVVGFIALPATYAFGGHAGAASPLLLSVVLSMWHVAAVATWFGGLVILVVDGSARIAEHVEWFSKRAVAMVPIAVLSGAAQTLVLTDSIRDLSDLAYGKWLIGKVILVLVMLLSAAVVRKRFMASGVSSLRGVLAAEMAIGLLVLAATSGLVAEPPRDTTGSAPFSTALVQGDIITNVTVSPARVGSVEMHVIISPPGGSLQPVDDARVRLSLPAREVPPIEVDLLAVGPNHYVGTTQIPFSGEWKLDVVVLVDANNEVLFTTVMKID
jgi:copper transport protein